MVIDLSSENRIELVRVEDIDRRWGLIVDRVVGCLSKAPSDFSAGDVWTQCRSGNWFLLLAGNENAVIGFSMWHFTGNGLFVCALLGGERMGDWLPETIDLATAIAKAHGCSGLAGTCRPGLMKLLQSRYLPQSKAVRVQFVAPI